MKRTHLVALSVVVALAVVAGLLLPGLQPATEGNRRPKCVWNLKMILYGCQLYSGDHDEDFPPTLGALFPEYISDGETLICPFAGRAEEISTADLPEGATNASAVWSDQFTDYVYVGGLRATCDPEFVLAYGREGNHKGCRVFACIGGMVTWRREEEFRGRLAKTETWIRAHPRPTPAGEDDQF
ncbi:MAG: hypothetical protein ACYTKD_25765 [Planctomycetota bacterium]|jgi:hypothetical protein